MSPEQLHGEALTPASDLFSLGAVMYEALTGRPPYPGETPEEVSAAHAAGTVRPPSTLAEGVPGRLDEAILQALRRDPQSRFRSADAMTVAIEAASAETSAEREDETRVIRTPAAGYVPPPAPQRPVATPRREPRQRAPTRRRSSGAWAGIGTLLVLVMAALVVVLVVVPLLQLGQGGGAPGPSSDASPSVGPTSVPNVVIVPDLVGMPTADAIAAAREAGLAWRVECAQDPSQPEGIIGQDPPAEVSIAPGSRFTMFSARISDCR